METSEISEIIAKIDINNFFWEVYELNLDKKNIDKKLYFTNIRKPENPLISLRTRVSNLKLVLLEYDIIFSFFHN